ncbi:MGAM [Branchiostoma lanceolatum]|uniref:MGAM protein n=1 Tax=Branchiostoma lanceolatum TaxID=7740 RepID=A0A8K0A302_BRALA|nr:MGAM [Branchiostoma lanceolatum]
MVLLTSALFLLFLGHVMPQAPEDRINCYPEKGAVPLQTACVSQRGCTWANDTTHPRVPICHYPADYGYEVTSKTRTVHGYRVQLRWRTGQSCAFSTPVQIVTLDVEHQTNNRLRFKFYDQSNPRYEVPMDMPGPETAASPEYEVEIPDYGLFSIKVTRRDTDTVIWDSSLGGFTFADQFLQITTKLPSRYVYGFGENEHATFHHDLDWRTWGMLTRDESPGPPVQETSSDGTTYDVERNNYGVHPFYMAMEENGNAHGVLLLNSNPQDVTFQPRPALTFRTIGGVLDFYMFLGPSPEEVVQQYTQAIGRPFMPPYWSLGFQVCRYGYKNLQHIQDVVDGMRNYNIPQDVQYADIDYMERQLDFTLDHTNFHGLPAYFRQLQDECMKTIIILDPAISKNETDYPAWDRGVQMDIWIKDENQAGPAYGKVWPEYADEFLPGKMENASWDFQVENYRSLVGFPDFLKTSTHDWWHEQILDFHNNPTDGIRFDGIWIDMNEPANFIHGNYDPMTNSGRCENNRWNNPDFKPWIMGDLYSKTICMDAHQEGTDGTTYRHYDVHNLYGWSQTPTTLRSARVATGKRSIVVTRSTFPGSGKSGGHWLGDNTSKWDHLHKSIIGMLEFNLFGIPYIGADICGFWGEPDREMCWRWMQLGAFYPYSRNHNQKDVIAEQDPSAWGPEFAEASRAVLLTRYRLLPYLYTLFYEAHTKGSTVVRPLLHEFRTDRNAWTVDRQFLWGPALLISPVLDQGATSVTAYMPDARWFDYYTGGEVSSSSRGSNMTIPCDMNCIPLHVRGGYIIPTQEPATNTKASRQNKFEMLVVLNDDEVAEGRLFWDDGESADTIESGDYLLLELRANTGGVTTVVTHKGYQPDSTATIGSVKVFGLKSTVGEVQLDGVTTSRYTYRNKVLHITSMDLDLAVNHEIRWRQTTSAAVHHIPARWPLLFVFAILYALLT